MEEGVGERAERETPSNPVFKGKRPTTIHQAVGGKRAKKAKRETSTRRQLVANREKGGERCDC